MQLSYNYRHEGAGNTEICTGERERRQEEIIAEQKIRLLNCEKRFSLLAMDGWMEGREDVWQQLKGSYTLLYIILWKNQAGSNV